MLDRQPRPPPARPCLKSEASARRRERDRRYREHVRRGEAVAHVVNDADDIDKLVRLRVLDESEAGDKAAVAAAIRQVLRNVRL
jgi:hypothetical protein